MRADNHEWDVLVRTIAFGLIVGAALAGSAVCLDPAFGLSDQANQISGLKIPLGYRDWKLISVAHEEGELNDLRAVLGNDVAINAYRKGKLPFPDGAVIVRLAWSYTPSEENNRAFGRAQSFVAGSAKEGVQFMVKNSTKYASTGGWGFVDFVNGRSVSASILSGCYSCHVPAKAQDFVFTHYAP